MRSTAFTENQGIYCNEQIMFDVKLNFVWTLKLAIQTQNKMTMVVRAVPLAYLGYFHYESRSFLSRSNSRLYYYTGTYELLCLTAVSSSLNSITCSCLSYVKVLSDKFCQLFLHFSIQKNSVNEFRTGINSFIY